MRLLVSDELVALECVESISYEAVRQMRRERRRRCFKGAAKP